MGIAVLNPSYVLAFGLLHVHGIHAGEGGGEDAVAGHRHSSGDLVKPRNAIVGRVEP